MNWTKIVLISFVLVTAGCQSAVLNEQEMETVVKHIIVAITKQIEATRAEDRQVIEASVRQALEERAIAAKIKQTDELFAHATVLHTRAVVLCKQAMELYNLALTDAMANLPEVAALPTTAQERMEAHYKQFVSSTFEAGKEHYKRNNFLLATWCFEQLKKRQERIRQRKLLSTNEWMQLEYLLEASRAADPNTDRMCNVPVMTIEEANRARKHAQEHPEKCIDLSARIENTGELKTGTKTKAK